MDITSPRQNFWRSLGVQRRIIGALMRRELVTRFGRHNLGALWIVAEPMVFTVGVALSWGFRELKHGGLPVAAFALTGYSSVLTWRNTISHCTSAVRDNNRLMFHRNVKALDVLLSRALLEIGGAAASFWVLSLFFIGINMIAPPEDLLKVFFGWFLLAWFAASAALTLGAGAVFTPLVERIWHPAAYLLFPLSGAAFLADWLTPQLRQIYLIVPMVHGVELLREGYFGGTQRYYYSIPFLVICNLVLTLSGLWLARAADRRGEE
jgi:ABC-type polysaccharide/polyol phosphate export permease